MRISLMIFRVCMYVCVHRNASLGDITKVVKDAILLQSCRRTTYTLCMRARLVRVHVGCNNKYYWHIGPEVCATGSIKSAGQNKGTGTTRCVPAESGWRLEWGGGGGWVVTGRG